MKIKSQGYHNKLSITENTTAKQLSDFTKEEINRRIRCYINEGKMWSHNNSCCRL